MAIRKLTARALISADLEPPQAIELEQSVLGVLMKDPGALDVVLPILRDASMFYDVRHQKIFQAILELDLESKPFDISMVAERIASKGDIEAVGSRTYLVDLCEAIATAVNVENYAEIVRDKWTLRRLALAAGKIARDAFEGLRPANEQLNSAEATIYSIAECGIQSKLNSLPAIIPQVTEKMLSIEKGNFEDVFQTRIADLNKVIGGLHRGESTFIAGEPSSGKTSLALDTCLYNFNWDRSCYFVSLDQTRDSIVTRLITSLTSIPKSRLFSGEMNENEKKAITKAQVDLMQRDRFFVNDDPNMTVLDIRSEARRIKRRHGLDIVVVDYIQLIPPHRRLDNRHQEISEISRFLNALAKELNVSMVILSQLNRNRYHQKVEWEKNNWNFPNMGMLRESGSLEQDANTILFPVVPIELLKTIYGEQSQYYKDAIEKYPRQNEMKELSSLAYIVVGKQKDGGKATVECRRDAVRMRFYSEAQNR